VRIPGKRWVFERVRRAKARRTPHLTILGYHRVAEAKFDPFDLAITPKEFDAQLRWLTTHARVVSLLEAMRDLERGTLAPHSVALTFDDGYDDTISGVVPALERHGVSATVFVTTGNLGEPYWWDTLTGLVYEPATLPDALSLTVGSEHFASASGNRDALLWTLSEQLRPMASAQRDEALRALVQWSGYLRRPDATRALTSAELQRLDAHPLVTVGAHSVTHPPLALLDAESQRREIQESIDLLNVSSAASVAAFSYPYGSFNKEVIEVVRATGIPYACASTPDVAYRGGDPLSLPRLWVDGIRRHTFSTWMPKWL